MAKFKLSPLHKRSRGDRDRFLKRVKDRNAKQHRIHVRFQTLSAILRKDDANKSSSSASSSLVKQEVKEEVYSDWYSSSAGGLEEVKVEQEKKKKKKKGGGKRKAEKIKKLKASLEDCGTTSVQKAQADEELQTIRFLRAGDKKKRARRRHPDNCTCESCSGKLRDS